MRRAAALLAATCLLASPTLGAMATAVTVEEQIFRGDLVGLDAAPVVTLRIGGKPRSLKGGDLLELRLRDAKPQPRAADAAVVLRGGGTLRGVIRGGGGRAVSLRSPVFGDVDVPLGAVARIELPNPAPAAAAVGPAGKLDRLFLLNGEVVEGSVEKLAEGKVAFRSTHLGLLDVTFDRLTAIGFAAESAAPKTALKGVLAVVHCDDGTSVPGRVGPLAGGKLTVRTHFGPALALDLARLLRIEFRGGRLTYLSDLEPVSVKETPALGNPFPYRVYRRDRSVDGYPLTIGDRTYRKGLGVHARCELVYALDGAYSRFMADVGINEKMADGLDIGDRGNVDVRVLVDGVVRFERKGITGRDEPIRVEVPVDGARQLTLVADFGAGLDICDHLDWANARLIR